MTNELVTTYQICCQNIRKMLAGADDKARMLNMELLPDFWKIGDKISEALETVKGEMTMEEAFEKLCKDLGPGFTRRKIVFSRNLHDRMSLDEVVIAAEKGATMSHFEHLMRIGDTATFQEQLALVTSGEDITASALKDMVDTVAAQSPELLTQNSQRRQKQVSTQKQEASENPIKCVPRMIKTAIKIQEDASTFTAALDNMRSLDVDNRMKVEQNLAELVEHAKASADVLKSVAEQAEAVLAEAERQKKKRKSEK